MRPTVIIEQGVDKIEFLFLRGYGDMLNGQKLRELEAQAKLKRPVCTFVERVESEKDSHLAALSTLDISLGCCVVYDCRAVRGDLALTWVSVQRIERPRAALSEHRLDVTRGVSRIPDGRAQG